MDIKKHINLNTYSQYLMIIFVLLFCYAPLISQVKPIIPLPTQFTTLYTMNPGAGNGYIPTNDLVSDGVYLYGVNSNDFSGSQYGTIFRINIDGTGFLKLHQFDGANSGKTPTGGLVLSDGVLYGTTTTGGTNNNGVLFKINTDGTGFTKLLDFNNLVTGKDPQGNLIKIGYTLFGTTQTGGANGEGIVYKIKTDGTDFTVLHTSGSIVSDARRYIRGFLNSGNMLYGLSLFGGLEDTGTIFKLDTNGGNYSVLVNFNAAQSLGSRPEDLILYNNKFYAVSRRGLTYDKGCYFSFNTDGTGITKLMESGGSNIQITRLLEYQGSLIVVGYVNYQQTYNNEVFYYLMSLDASSKNLLYDFNPGGLPGAPGIPQGKPLIIDDVIYSATAHGGDIPGNIIKFILPSTPNIETESVYSISDSNAYALGHINNNAYATITASGFVWSTSTNPTINSNTGITIGTDVLGDYTSILSNLYSNETYYIRAYATNFMGTAYGNEITILTSKSEEDNAPNNGNGNDDGIADSRQSSVESYIEPKSNEYVTIQELNGENVDDIEFLEVNTNDEYLYTTHFIKFTIPSSSGKMRVYFHGISNPSSYVIRKMDKDGNIYTPEGFTLKTRKIGGVQTVYAEFNLADGSREDYDGLVNGSITDPIALAIPISAVANVPIWDNFWRIIVIVGLVIIPIFWLRRKS